MSKSLRWGLVAAGIAVLALAGWWLVGRGDAGATDVTIETATVQQGDVRRIVAATGAVRALVTVEVGSQLSGQISELLVDYNDTVEAGQVIAHLDPQTYAIRVREAEAARATAAASLALQRASLARAEANARAAQSDFERLQTLHERGIAAQSALDPARAAYEAAQADLGVARAQIRNAQAVLEQREATLENARVDLERTTIRSPISGIVVDRAVDEGQTVAASMSAPTLFTIAQDLGQVQIDAQVDEADIGQIARGQPVHFTVDAHPGTQLSGQVEQIRLAPTSLNNVVTYTVVVSAANPGQRLLPGMTANMDIVTGDRSGVLTVPNAALRFRPAPVLEARARPLEEGAGGARRGAGPGGAGGPMARMTESLDLTAEQSGQVQAAFRSVFGRARSTAQSGAPADRDALQDELTRALQDILTADQMARYRELQREARETRMATVWVQEAGGLLVERRIRLGIGDSQSTEVVDGDLEVGEAVVVRAREQRG